MIAELVMSASGMVNRIKQWPAYRLTRNWSMRRGEGKMKVKLKLKLEMYGEEHLEVMLMLR